MYRFRKSLIEEISCCIAMVDPYEIGDDNMDEDSYTNEAEIITDDLLKGGSYLFDDIKSALCRCFEGDGKGKLSDTIAKEISEEIFDIFDSCKDCLRFYEDNEIRSRLVEGDICAAMKINDHFTVDSMTWQKNKTIIYINEVQICECKKKDAVEYYKKLLNDFDSVYIQYKPKPDMFGINTAKIKIVKKSKFNYDKLSKKEKIEKIFDRYGLIK